MITREMKEEIANDFLVRDAGDWAEPDKDFGGRKTFYMSIKAIIEWYEELESEIVPTESEIVKSAEEIIRICKESDGWYYYCIEEVRFDWRNGFTVIIEADED